MCADHESVTVGILVGLLTLLGAALVICIKRKTLLGLLFTSKNNNIEKLRYLLTSPALNPVGHTVSLPRLLH